MVVPQLDGYHRAIRIAVGIHEAAHVCLKSTSYFGSHARSIWYRAYCRLCRAMGVDVQWLGIVIVLPTAEFQDHRHVCLVQASHFLADAGKIALEVRIRGRLIAEPEANRFAPKALQHSGSVMSQPALGRAQGWDQL